MEGKRKVKDLGLLPITGGKNRLFSPLTIGRCLYLIADASDGNTKEHIQEMIGSAGMSNFENIDGVIRESFFVGTIFIPG